MPSPFPGMDPYLENPGLWPDVHHRLISISADLLTAQIRPKYFTRIEERVYVSDESDPGRSVIVPDLRIAAVAGTKGSVRPAASAVADVAEPITLRTLIEDEIREAHIEVVDREDRSVVTVIKFVSPANKVPGARGRADYERKRREVMASESHFVEIDLLRQGSGPGVRDRFRACDYFIHVSRVEQRPEGQVWAVLLRQQLPPIPIPLCGGDPDSTLDLQAVLSTAYDRAAYDLDIDYSRDAVPPLTDEAAEWAGELLRTAGLRGAH